MKTIQRTPYAELENIFKDIVEASNQDLMQENANVDGQAPLGQMGKFASESAKHYAMTQMIPEHIKKAIQDNIVYPHDLDYMPTGTTTCVQIPLSKILKDGFSTGHGHMREPQSISSAMDLSSIIFQSNQNMQHGGQSFPTMDKDLAPYVRKSYEKKLKQIHAIPTTMTDEEKEDWAWEEADKETYQACEAFIHNSNSMHSRGGGQVPFISVNYGTDTSKEGRIFTKNFLLATQAGLGNGETPIFPIQIFKMKKGINFYEEDPNYDLYQLALETTAKRLFPNFSFIDAPFNLQHYDGTQESEIAYMGCRTRSMANIHGEETSIGRGNLSFTSINLVKIALMSDSIEDFYSKLDHYLSVAEEQLYERFLFQSKKKAKNFPFLYGQGVWRDSESLKPEDTLEEVLKHGTLSVGFIGLAEALVALTGHHHGESEASLSLGLDIITHMRNRMDESKERRKLNYSLIASPAEGLSGKFVKKDAKDFGLLPGVTDREYYTNSFHIPVHYNILAHKKIAIEGAFHGLCNAGHITYIEVDGDVSKNIQALDKIVKSMSDAGVGYGSINHPVDRCTCCNYVGIIDNRCPKCNNRDESKIDRIRRITGYLVGTMSKWNSAKQAEERERVKHNQARKRI